MIARSTGLARSTVGDYFDYLDRATAVGLSWPLPPTLTDAALEAMLFARAGIAPGTRRKAEPDWPVIHRELRRPGVTLMLLWQEYRAQNPKAYGKAKVEAGVLVVERWILARLRNRRFFSLTELNAAIARLVARS